MQEIAAAAIEREYIFFSKKTGSQWGQLGCFRAKPLMCYWAWAKISMKVSEPSNDLARVPLLCEAFFLGWLDVTMSN
jgi:hypothetical protein